MNLARLNHILIPTSWARRRELQRRWYLRPFAFAGGGLYEALSVEGRALALLTLAAGFLGLDVQWTSTHLLWAGLTGLLLAGLLVRPFFRLDGVHAELEVPRRVAAGELLRFTVHLHNAGARAHHGVRLLGPFLPWDGQFDGEPEALRSLAPGERARVHAQARFTARGEHHLGPFAVAALCPLGLTVGPPLRTPDSRFLVLPQIAPVRGVHSPLAHRYQPGGVAMASKTGESLELMGVRPYRPGDPVRDLHAPTWARTGEPMVREYQQEYFSRVGVILDVDGGVATEAQLEAAISLCAGVLAWYSRGEALIDLLVIGDEVHPLTIGRSVGTLEQGLDLLAVVARGPSLAPEALAQRLRPHLARLSTVVFVALRWDEARAAVVEEVQRHGVGCRPVVVADAARAGEVPGEVPRLTPAEVASGRPVTL